GSRAVAIVGYARALISLLTCRVKQPVHPINVGWMGHWGCAAASLDHLIEWNFAYNASALACGCT
ncbi:MAG: hypothetical protein AAF729_09955, partial [Pseudomonadota bacterium]